MTCMIEAITDHSGHVLLKTPLGRSSFSHYHFMVLLSADGLLMLGMQMALWHLFRASGVRSGSTQARGGALCPDQEFLERFF